jgi:hypothetical protein
LSDAEPETQRGASDVAAELAGESRRLAGNDPISQNREINNASTRRSLAYPGVNHAEKVVILRSS